MIIDCICGKKKFKLAEGVMPAEGSKVRCGSCSEVWFYHPKQGNNPSIEDTNTENISSSEDQFLEESTIDNESEIQPDLDELNESTNEKPLEENDPEELLSTIDNDESNQAVEESNDKSVSNFKIFTDEQDNLPSKDEMDKNLDDFVLERDKNLNFFQKLFKKDRLTEASKSLEKEEKQRQVEKDQEKSNDARRTRLLAYLLILLLIVLSVVLVPYRDHVGMAFPFMESYLEFLKPMHDYIKGPLGLK